MREDMFIISNSIHKQTHKGLFDDGDASHDTFHFQVCTFENVP